MTHHTITDYFSALNKWENEALRVCGNVEMYVRRNGEWVRIFDYPQRPRYQRPLLANPDGTSIPRETYSIKTR